MAIWPTGFSAFPRRAPCLQETNPRPSSAGTRACTSPGAWSSGREDCIWLCKTVFWRCLLYCDREKHGTHLLEVRRWVAQPPTAQTNKFDNGYYYCSIPFLSKRIHGHFHHFILWFIVCCPSLFGIVGVKWLSLALVLHGKSWQWTTYGHRKSKGAPPWGGCLQCNLVVWHALFIPSRRHWLEKTLLRVIFGFNRSCIYTYTYTVEVWIVLIHI